VKQRLQNKLISNFSQYPPELAYGICLTLKIYIILKIQPSYLFLHLFVA